MQTTRRAFSTWNERSRNWSRYLTRTVLRLARNARGSVTKSGWWRGSATPWRSRGPRLGLGAPHLAGKDCPGPGIELNGRFQEEHWAAVRQFRSHLLAKSLPLSRHSGNSARRVAHPAATTRGHVPVGPGAASEAPELVATKPTVGPRVLRARKAARQWKAGC
jgi:hypothetical protein